MLPDSLLALFIASPSQALRCATLRCERCFALPCERCAALRARPPAGAAPAPYVERSLETPRTGSFVHLHLGIDASGLPDGLEGHHLIVDDWEDLEVGGDSLWIPSGFPMDSLWMLFGFLLSPPARRVRPGSVGGLQDAAAAAAQGRRRAGAVCSRPAPTAVRAG